MTEKVDVFIDKDNEKYMRKKLCLNNSLKSIRINLHLSDSIFFMTEDGYQIDIEDEEQNILKDILINKDKSYFLLLKTNKKNLIPINVYLNNKKIYSGDYSDKVKLKDLIKDVENILPKDSILYCKGYQIDIPEYEDALIIDTFENNSLYFRTEEYKKKNSEKKDFKRFKLNQNESESEEEDEDNSRKSLENISENDKTEYNGEQVIIKIGKEQKIKKLILSEKLNTLREYLKKDIPFRFKFLAKKIPLEENEENKWTINNILIREKDSNIIYIENCEMGNKVDMENRNKLIKFYDCKKKLLFKQKLDVNQTLDNTRENISQNIIDEFKFMKNKIEIEEEEESDYLLKEIIKDDSVKIKINDVSNPKDSIKEKNTFIKFKLNGKELFANIINHNLTLLEVRRNFNLIPIDAVFLKDGYNVIDEKAVIIEDILKDNEFIFLRTEDEDKKNAPPPVEIKEKMKLYDIFLNGQFLQHSKQKEKTTLKDLRILLSKEISDKEQFISIDNEEIPLENESNWTLKDYSINNNKIIIKTTKIVKTQEPEENKKKLNEPIKDSKLIYTKDNLHIYEYPNIPFTDNEKIGVKTIMVVGETGSGKTTLLNSFLNYLMGINYDDTFRYKIILEDNLNKNPGVSVTDKVNIYYIRTTLKDLPFIRIVDTPGFGDTRGIEYDKCIIDMIRKTFTKDCETINAICFVAKSNETRLTDFQKYIFGRVIGLFGKDVGENFIAMLTFSDGQTPNIVSCLESKESIFSEIREQIQSPWYLTFNNSAIFCGVDLQFTRNFWDLGMASYRSFVQKLKMLPDKSLYLSRQVLDLRKKLETTIVGLRPQLDKSLGIMENIRKQITQVKANKDKIDQFKDFKYRYKEPKVTPKNLRQGEYTTNCTICNYTCHYPCYIPDNKNKMNCSAMMNNFCTVCKKKCKWDQHKNLNYIFIYEEIEKTKTSEDLRKKYVESTSNLKQSEQIIKGLETEFFEILKDCYNNAEQIKKSVEELKKISLCKNPNESFEEYIKNCIIKEETEKNPGYLDRIKGYTILKDTNDKIIKAFRGQEIFEDLDKFKDFFLKEKKEIIKMFEEEDSKNCLIY